MRSDGTFIAVEVDDGSAGDAETARRLTDACPVDVFAQNEDGTLRIEQGNLDECVLCRLCIDAVSRQDPVPVRVVKLYDAGALLA